MEYADAHLERRGRVETVEDGSSTETTPTDLERRQQIRNRRDFTVGYHWTGAAEMAVRGDTQSSIDVFYSITPFDLTNPKARLM